MCNYLIIKNADARIYDLKLPPGPDYKRNVIYISTEIATGHHYIIDKSAVIKTLIVSFERIDKFFLENEPFHDRSLFKGYFDDGARDPDYEIYLEGVKIIKFESTKPELDALIKKFPNFEQMKFDVYKTMFRAAPSVKCLSLEDASEDALNLILEVGEE